MSKQAQICNTFWPIRIGNPTVLTQKLLLHKQKVVPYCFVLHLSTRNKVFLFNTPLKCDMLIISVLITYTSYTHHINWYGPVITQTVTGDTIVSSKASAAVAACRAHNKAEEERASSREMNSLVLAGVEVPEPVFFCSIEPPSMAKQAGRQLPSIFTTRETKTVFQKFWLGDLSV